MFTEFQLGERTAWQRITYRSSMWRKGDWHLGVPLTLLRCKKCTLPWYKAKHSAGGAGRSWHVSSGVRGVREHALIPNTHFLPKDSWEHQTLSEPMSKQDLRWLLCNGFGEKNGAHLPDHLTGFSWPQFSGFAEEAAELKERPDHLQKRLAALTAGRWVDDEAEEVLSKIYCGGECQHCSRKATHHPHGNQNFSRCHHQPANSELTRGRTDVPHR